MLTLVALVKQGQKITHPVVVPAQKISLQLFLLAQSLALPIDDRHQPMNNQFKVFGGEVSEVVAEELVIIGAFGNDL